MSLAESPDQGFVMSDDTSSVEWCVIGHVISGGAQWATSSSFSPLRLSQEAVVGSAALLGSLNGQCALVGRGVRPGRRGDGN